MPKKATKKVAEYRCDKCMAMTTEKNICSICRKILCKTHMGNYFSVLENYEFNHSTDSKMHVVGLICEACQKGDIKIFIEDVRKQELDMIAIEKGYLRKVFDHNKKINELHSKLVEHLVFRNY